LRKIIARTGKQKMLSVKFKTSWIVEIKNETVPLESQTLLNQFI